MPASEATPEHTHWNLTSLFWLSLAFLCGIVLGSSTRLTTGNWMLLGGASLALFAALILTGRFLSRPAAPFLGRFSGFRGFLGLAWTKITILFSSLRAPVHPLLLLAVIASGAARYQNSQPALSSTSLAAYNDAQYAYMIEGIIIKPPEYRETQTHLVIRVDRLRPVYDMNFTDVDGLLLAEVSSYKNWHYGDRIRLEGELRTPLASEDFSYEDYLASRGIYSLIESPQAILIGRGMGNPILSTIYIIRERAYATIYNLFPDPEASLFAGILLGMDANIPAHVEGAFIETGTSHIIAISGYDSPMWICYLLMVAPDSMFNKATSNKCSLLCTDLDDWIHITTNGKQLWVEVERK